MTKKSFILSGWLSSLLIVFLSIGFAQTREDCFTCHSDSSLTKEANGKQISLFVSEATLNNSPHKKLVCVACHTRFNPDNIPHKNPIGEVNCMTCHQGVQQKHTFHPQLAQAIKDNQAPDVSCKDCHGTHDIVSPKVPDSKFSSTKIAESCGECHGDVTEHFSESAHGKAFTAKITGAPQCLTCHTSAVSNAGGLRDSLEVKVAQEQLCLSCHLDNPDVRARTSPTTGFIAEYDKSVHGSALRGGNAKAANCVDCHSSHEMKKGVEATSKVNKQNIPETCGKCHTDIVQQYKESVHGIALSKGVHDAPVCTDCHGEHSIFKHTDPRSSVASANVSKQCTACHGSVKLSQKFGLAGDRMQTFEDSYHGLAMKGGDANVANCASCHGAHNIKPSNDSTSMVNKANLATTCGKCHPGANAQFSVGSVHVTMAQKEEPSLYWLANIYITLIITTIGFMFIHNALDFIKKSKRKLMIRRGELVEEHFGHSLYVRMTLNERLQHGMLVVSFVVLVLTGFMLRFPDTWWVKIIRSVSDHVFEYRSLIHRIAAIMMTVASLYHIYYLAFTERGKALLKDLIPKIQDAKDAMAILKYNTGMSKVKPQFGRFSYIEKSEYWALVWGTIVMAMTGMIMWFDNTFIGMFTKLGYDIARTVHYYEAWLATLAIIVWHFYYVIFNPDVYPVSLVFWKGTLTENEMEEEHPLELAELRKKELESKKVSGDSDNEVNSGNGESKTNISPESIVETDQS